MVREAEEQRAGATFPRLHTGLGRVGTEVQVHPPTSVVVLPSWPLGTVKGAGKGEGLKNLVCPNCPL